MHNCATRLPPLPHRLEVGVASVVQVRRHWHSFPVSRCMQWWCTHLWTIFSGCYKLLCPAQQRLAVPNFDCHSQLSKEHLVNFHKLFVKKIVKILATRSQILRIERTKFDFGWGSAPDPAGGAYSTVSSLYSMQQLGPSPVFVARSILQMLSPVFTGSEHPSASSSNWRSLSTECFTSVLVRPAAVRCWSADEMSRPAALVDLQSYQCPPVVECHCRQSLFCCCWPTTLELPADVQSAPSLATFLQKLKMHLFWQ